MLTHLRVQSLVLIEELEIPFGPGLNVLTGETGAGKSVLVAALQLVAGARARPEQVRAGAPRAEVEALFDLREDAAARARLAALGMDEDEELVLRRVVEAEGRSRAWVNGRLCTSGQLATLAQGLVEISSQHAHHSLVDPATHLDCLDGYAGLRAEVAEVGRAWAAWRAGADAAEALLARLRSDRGDVLRLQLAELERGGFGEAEEAELRRLRHAEELGAACGRAGERLDGGEGAVARQLLRARAELDGAARLDPGLLPLRDRVEAAVVEVVDVARDLDRYQRGVRDDPARRAELEERQHERRRLQRKHGEDLGEASARLRAEAAELAAAGERLQALEAARDHDRARLEALAAALGARRRAAAAALGAGVTAQLGALGMPDARVEVAVRPAATLGPTGGDHVELHIVTNRGEAPRPLGQIASGGELSRVLLATRSVLAEAGPVGLHVFDEVDTGVGGAVAAAIGARLRALAGHRQVLCITHLPQVAACADHHLHVSKHHVGDRTASRVAALDLDARVEELARMLGGARVGDAARATARELLAGGGRSRPARGPGYPRPGAPAPAIRSRRARISDGPALSGR